MGGGVLFELISNGAAGEQMTLEMPIFVEHLLTEAQVHVCTPVQQHTGTSQTNFVVTVVRCSNLGPFGVKKASKRCTVAGS